MTLIIEASFKRTMDIQDGIKNPPAAPKTPLTSLLSSINMIGDDLDIGLFPGFFSSLVKL